MSKTVKIGRRLDIYTAGGTHKSWSYTLPVKYRA